MKATQILMDEHRVIERVLGALEAVISRAKGGEAIRPGFFLDAADFIKNFADGCHHRKEEGVLFISMADAGVPVQGGPIGVMLSEHEQGRAFTGRMREAAGIWEAGDPAAQAGVLQNAAGYCTLLRQHIYKEDHVLFPMADRVVPREKHNKIDEEFDRIELEEISAGVHETYHALADKLVEESHHS